VKHGTITSKPAPSPKHRNKERTTECPLPSLLPRTNQDVGLSRSAGRCGRQPAAS